MPLDEEARREIEGMLSEMRDELRSARTPREREAVRSETRADLEDVLRENGYRLSRRELDEIMRKRDDDRIAAAVDRRLAELAADAEAEDDGEEGDDDGDDDGSEEKPKPKSRAKPKPKPKAGTTAAEGGEEEWV